MFNLLVGLMDGVVPPGRLFEYTNERVRDRIGTDYVGPLQILPTVSMPEIGDYQSEQVARIGSVTNLRSAGNSHRFTFVPDPNFAPLGTHEIERIADWLDISPGSWEFQRTHWAVKDVDLFRILFQHYAGPARVESDIDRSRGPVSFPTDLPRDADLVAVMMPFSPEFDVVYETIEAATADVGLRCVRVDTIWEEDHVMADVASLLWRASVVVADLTGKNANVFYEVGLAHALPRRTVLLTQSADDVPFDLRSIRYLHYGLSTAARALLRSQLGQRLQALAQKVS